MSGLLNINLRLVNDAPEQGKSFSPTENPITIGCDGQNDFALDDHHVDRRHCEITFESEKVFIADAGSSSGTFVNGKLIRRSPLIRGDQIRIGKTTLIYDDSFGPAPIDDSDPERRRRMVEVGETTLLMHHRINNILQGISGGTYLVETGLEKGEHAMLVKGWESVSKNQAELSKLIVELLRLGKFYRPVKRPADLVAMTRESISRLAEEIRAAGIDIKIDKQPSPLNTRVDIQAMQLAIENLLHVAINACRHHDDPCLEIRFEKPAGFVLLQIEYRGAQICMDPEELLDPVSPDERIVGGIEFAISRKTIRQHQGRILLAKTAELKERISVTLPDDSGQPLTA